MSSKLVNEILVPAEHGWAWKINSGQRMRIIAIEGPQVGDMAVFNAHYYKETYNSDFFYLSNCYLGTGDSNRIRYMYSCPPWYHLMLEITDDKIATNWVQIGGHCNQRSKELRGSTPILPSTGTRRTCQDNLAEVIAPSGMTAEDVPHTLNFWMKIVYAPDGTFAVPDSPAQKGDYIDFLAHTDCLISLSTCPTPEINAGSNKPLKVEIYE